MDQLNVRAWEGRTDLQEGVISGAQAAQIHATLGSSRPCRPHHGRGDGPAVALVRFHADEPDDRAGPRRAPHPRGFPAARALERRMWASGSLSFGAPLRVGERLTKRSFIRSVTEKRAARGRWFWSRSITRSMANRAWPSRNGRTSFIWISPTHSARRARSPCPDNPVLHERRQISEPLLVPLFGHHLQCAPHSL